MTCRHMQSTLAVVAILIGLAWQVQAQEALRPIGTFHAPTSGTLASPFKIREMPGDSLSLQTKTIGERPGSFNALAKESLQVTEAAADGSLRRYTLLARLEDGLRAQGIDPHSLQYTALYRPLPVGVELVDANTGESLMPITNPYTWAFYGADAAGGAYFILAQDTPDGEPSSPRIFRNAQDLTWSAPEVAAAFNSGLTGWVLLGEMFSLSGVPALPMTPYPGDLLGFYGPVLHLADDEAGASSPTGGGAGDDDKDPGPGSTVFVGAGPKRIRTVARDCGYEVTSLTAKLVYEVNLIEGFIKDIETYTIEFQKIDSESLTKTIEEKSSLGLRFARVIAEVLHLDASWYKSKDKIQQTVQQFLRIMQFTVWVFEVEVQGEVHARKRYEITEVHETVGTECPRYDRQVVKRVVYGPLRRFPIRQDYVFIEKSAPQDTQRETRADITGRARILVEAGLARQNWEDLLPDPSDLPPVIGPVMK